MRPPLDPWRQDDALRRIVKRRVPPDTYEAAHPLLTRAGRAAAELRSPDLHPEERAAAAFALGAVRPMGPDGSLPWVVRAALVHLIAVADALAARRIASTSVVARAVERHGHPSLAGRFLRRLEASEAERRWEADLFLPADQDRPYVSWVGLRAARRGGIFRIAGEWPRAPEPHARLLLAPARLGDAAAPSLFLVPWHGPDSELDAEAYLIGEPEHGFRHAAELWPPVRILGAAVSTAVIGNAARREGSLSLALEAARALDLADRGDPGSAAAVGLLARLAAGDPRPDPEPPALAVVLEDARERLVDARGGLNGLDREVETLDRTLADVADNEGPVSSQRLSCIYQGVLLAEAAAGGGTRERDVLRGFVASRAYGPYLGLAVGPRHG